MPPVTELPEMKKVDPIEKELEALRIICEQLNSVQSETRMRIISYLKSKFRQDWPYEAS